jgi:hypothetical protein
MTVLDQAKAIRAAMDNAAIVLTDAQALYSKELYPRWDDLMGEKVEMGFRFRYGDDLYKTRQKSYTFVPHYIPGATGTESLFEVINETNSGTKEDPIPYEGNMALEAGLYYSQDGVTYICTRSTGNAIYHALKDLVGLYVEVAE